MSGADRRSDVWVLRRVVDGIDLVLRSLIRLRVRCGAAIIRRKKQTTDKHREQQILDKCASETEATIFAALFRASKAGVQRAEHDGDREPDLERI